MEQYLDWNGKNWNPINSIIFNINVTDVLGMCVLMQTKVYLEFLQNLVLSLFLFLTGVWNHLKCIRLID